jgi:hypothetical protein
MSVVRTTELARCGIAQIKRVTALHRAKARVINRGGVVGGRIHLKVRAFEDSGISCL